MEIIFFAIKIAYAIGLFYGVFAIRDELAALRRESKKE
jgi:hypothetical protein